MKHRCRHITPRVTRNMQISCSKEGWISLNLRTRPGRLGWILIAVKIRLAMIRVIPRDIWLDVLHLTLFSKQNMCQRAYFETIVHKNQSYDRTGRGVTFSEMYFRDDERASDSGHISVISLVTSRSTSFRSDWSKSLHPSSRGGLCIVFWFSLWHYIRFLKGESLSLGFGGTQVPIADIISVIHIESVGMDL
jgi:hypothetical protein